MKTPRTKRAKPASRTGSAPEPKALPATSELARVAALLAQGQAASNGFSVQAVARQAIELWLACEQQKEAYGREQQARQEARNRELVEADDLRKLASARDQPDFGGLPHPATFPLGLDVFLRHALPNRRTEDRAKIFREFTRARLQYDTAGKPVGPVVFENGDFAWGAVAPAKGPAPTDEDCHTETGRRRAAGISEAEYPGLLKQLRAYAQWYRDQKVKARASAGGKARVKRLHAAAPVGENQVPPLT